MEIKPIAHIHYMRSQPPKSRQRWSTLLPQLGKRIRRHYKWRPSQSQESFFLAAKRGEHILSNMGTGNAKSWSCAAYLLNRALAKHLGSDPTFRHAICWMPTNGVSMDQEEKLRQLLYDLDAKQVSVKNYGSDLKPHQRYQFRSKCQNIDILYITPDMWRDSLIGSHHNQNKDTSEVATRWVDFLLTPSVVLIDELDYFSSYTLTHLYYLLRLMQDQCHQRKLPPPQVLINSATIRTPHQFLDQFLGSGVVIQGPSRRGPINLWVYPLHITSPDQPQETLLEKLLGIAIDNETGLIGQGLKILIYLQNKAEIERILLTNELARRSIDEIHASLKGTHNRRILQAFRDGDLPCLFTTSYLDRGLDIDSLTHVILVGFPRHSINDFIQRIHRVARTPTTAGTAYLLLDENRILDRYYLTHPEDITPDLTHLTPDPLRINPTNPLVIHSIVSLALLLGYTTHEQLTRLFNKDSKTQELVTQALFQLRIDGYRYATNDNTLLPHTSLKDYSLSTKLRTSQPTRQIITQNPEDGGTIGNIPINMVQRKACTGNTIILEGKPWTIIRHQGHQIIVQPGPPDRYSHNRLTHHLTYTTTAKRQLSTLTISTVNATIFTYPTELRDYPLNRETTKPLNTQPTTPNTRIYTQHTTAGLLFTITTPAQDPEETKRHLTLLGAALRTAAWQNHGTNPNELTTTLIQGTPTHQLLLHDTDGNTGHTHSLWDTLSTLTATAQQLLQNCGCKGRGCPHCWLRFTPTSTPPHPADIQATQKLLQEVKDQWM